MAEVRIEGNELVVRLSGPEKLAALRGDVRVPRDAVRAVEVIDGAAALTAVRGVRAPGVHSPGRTRIGTWRRRHGQRTFSVVRGRRPAVRIVLADGQRYRQLVVSTPDAAATAAGLR